MLFKKKSNRNLESRNCYITIDNLPIKIWFGIHKTGDLTMLIKGVIPFTDKIALQLGSVWNNIYDEYITRFGLTDEFMVDLRDEIKLANLRADFIITGQRHLRTLIRVEEEKKKLLGADIQEPLELENVLAKISKYYGFKLSSKDLTVAEYYSYINNALKNG